MNHYPPAIATSIACTLFFKRSREHGPPPSQRQAVVAKHVADWKAKDTDWRALETVRAREAQTASDLADSERRLVEAREKLALKLTTTNDDPVDAEQAVSDAEAAIAKLTSRLEVVRRQVRVAHHAAAQSFNRLNTRVADSEMKTSKPKLEAVVAKIERVVSPLLDELHAARRDFDSAGKNFPDPVEVLGPPPLRDASTEHTRQPGDAVPITIDNRLRSELRRIVGPAPAKSVAEGSKPAFAFGGNRPWD